MTFIVLARACFLAAGIENGAWKRLYPETGFAC